MPVSAPDSSAARGCSRSTASEPSSPAAILALAGPLSPWLAAVIVGVALFAVAGIAALVGRREVAQATPPVPTEAVSGVKQDVGILKPGSGA